MNQLKIEIGDTVKIVATSGYYHSRYESNPRCEGVCTELDEDDDVPFIVEWANGHVNYYNLCDLTLIKKGKKGMKEFTKSDLKTGMFVKLRDEKFRIVLGENLCGDERSWNRLSNYKFDLNSARYKDSDIIAVYNTSEGCSLTTYLEGHFLTPIWERTEQTEAQKEMEVLQEQAKALQEQITKLQGKL
jgi:hypothetical protein